MTKRPVTVFEVAVRNAGLRDAIKGMLYVTAWAAATAERGEPLETVEDYAFYWRQSRAKSFREQAAMRKAFPGHETPDDLLAALKVEVAVGESREVALARLASTPAPA